MTAKKSLKNSFPTEWRGVHCPTTQQGRWIALTQLQWEQMWRDAYGNASKAPKLPKERMAVGIFNGQTSTCDEVFIGPVMSQGGRTEISYRVQTHPCNLCVMFESFAIKWVKKTNVDNGIIFKRNLLKRDVPNLNRKRTSP